MGNSMIYLLERKKKRKSDIKEVKEMIIISSLPFVHLN